MSTNSKTSGALMHPAAISTKKNRGLNKTTGSIFIDKPEVFEDIVADVPLTDKAKTNYSYRPRRASVAAELTATDVQRQLLKDQLQIDAEKLERITKENIEKSIRRKATKQDETFSRLITDVDECRRTLDAIDKNLGLIEETKRNKLRRQFEDWNTQVHGTIQMNIAKQVDSLSTKTLNRRRNEDYAKFLDVSNRKAAIFRDIIIESEYDPLEPNRRALKVTTMKLKDPCKLDAQKAAVESAMLGSPSKRSAFKLGKDTLPVEQWATGKIEATPYGTFAKMMDSGNSTNEGGNKKATKINPTRQSNIVLDDFNYPRGKASVDAEMPRGKRIFPTLVYADPSSEYGGSIKF